MTPLQRINRAIDRSARLSVLEAKMNAYAEFAVSRAAGRPGSVRVPRHVYMHMQSIQNEVDCLNPASAMAGRREFRILLPDGGDLLVLSA